MLKVRSLSWLVYGALAGSVGLVASAAAQASPFTTAQVNTYAEGAYVGGVGGLQASLTNGAEFTAEIRAEDSAIVVMWTGAGTSLPSSLTLAGPSGAPITVGTYTGASGGQLHEPWRPELDLEIHKRRCGGVTDSTFTVHRLETGPGNTVTALDVSFEHRCPHEYAQWGPTLGRLMLNVTPPPLVLWGSPGAFFADGLRDDPTRVRVATGNHFSGPVSITARVFSVATGEQVGTTSNFVLQPRINGGTYVSSDRLPITEPGLYRIDATVTGLTGSMVQPGLGYLAVNHGSIVDSLGLDRSYLDLDHRTATISGVLKRKDFSTGQLSPIAAATVFVRAPSNRIIATLVTGPDGAFSHLLTQPDTVFVTFADNPSSHTTGTESSSLTLEIHRTPIQVTYDVSPIWTSTGLGTVSGQLTYEHGTTRVPLAGVQVELQDQGNVVGTATTDATGRFAAPFVPLDPSVTHLAFVIKTTDPFLLPPHAGIGIKHYRTDGYFTALQGFWATNTTVTWLGLIEFPSVQPLLVPISLQYRQPGTSEWITAATIEAVRWENAWYFETTVPVPCLAEWRAVYGPETSPAAATPPLLVSRLCIRKPVPLPPSLRKLPRRG